jgi:lactoylglutathione lyase
MTRRELFPILACRDLARAREFYQSVLGGREQYRFPDEGEPVYLTLDIGGSTLGLADGTGETAYGERALPSSGHPGDLCVYVDDLDAVLAAAPKNGGALVAAAADMPWGERVGWVRDPDGVHVLVIQAEPDTAE